MGCRRIGAVLLLAMSLALPGPANADTDPRQVFVTAPYQEATAAAGCFDSLGLTGTCVTFDASADAETGGFDLELLARTRDEGSSLGVVTGVAEAWFTATSVRSTATQAVLGVASFGFDELLAEPSGTLPLLSSIDVSVEIVLEHDTCAACVGRAEKLLDVPSDPPAEASVLAVMADPLGGPVPPGTIRASVHVMVTATLEGIGEVHGRVVGALRHVELATPSVERMLAAPYTAARADRGCNGSIGTTFTCRSAVARSTGRLEMDLDVISPVAGTAPGSGNASGDAAITLEDTPSEPVRARIYVVDLRVDSAEAFVQGATPLIGWTESAISTATAVAGPCDACASGASAGIVDAHGGPVSLLDEMLRMAVWSRQEADAPAAEELQLTFSVYGSSVLQNSAGIATALLRSRLAEVRVYEIV
ncbi:MAG TPA: hypothetical protein VGB52_09885 [Actinomycetota bacterium]